MHRAARLPLRLAPYALVAPLAACSGSSFTLDDRPDAGDVADGSDPGHDAGALDATSATDSGRPGKHDAAPSEDAETKGDAASPDAAAPDAGPASQDTGVIDSAGPPTDPCAGGSIGVASDAGSASHVSGYGFIDIISPDDDPVVAFTTTLRVPPAPPASGTVFLWPGLQPSANAAGFQPIDNGVLQPVLTWGPTCAPGSPASSYGSWWVSAQYVNTIGHAAGFTGCQGGTGMNVPVADALTMRMWLEGTTWKKTVTSAQTGQSVSYSIDLRGQSQNIAELAIEGYKQEPTAPVEFTSTVLTFQHAAAASCQPFARGATDDYAAPRISKDGTTCCYERITLRPQGI
jgi:hypothetical protein